MESGLRFLYYRNEGGFDLGFANLPGLAEFVANKKGDSADLLHWLQVGLTEDKDAPDGEPNDLRVAIYELLEAITIYEQSRYLISKGVNIESHTQYLQESNLGIDNAREQIRECLFAMHPQVQNCSIHRE